ncbi:MAG: hypothetical protein OXR68_03175 [Alphaproteobacteria bacterium]|nr:hypothetical protein [Alphaproteobacteria bacterium]MDD9919607.1 hypothetical protein [Alphaproteobacteria bacterium]
MESAIIIKTLLSTFAVTFVYILLGRLVAAHAAPRQAFLTPLASLTTGIGIWLFWFVGLAGALGTSLDTTFYLFIGASFLLLLGMFQTFKSFQGVEHFWSKLITSMLLVYPLWSILALDAPQLPQELAETAKNLALINHFQHLPNQAETLSYNIAGLSENPALWATVLPITLLTQTFVPGIFAVLNLIVFLAATGSLVQASGMQIRWSNLPLITAGSLFGITLFNPFFTPEIITAALPDVLIAASLLMLTVPLIRPTPLPVGFAVLPSAFTAVAAALLSQKIWPILIILAAFWAARTLLIEKKKISISHLFGWVSLGALPTLAVLLWREYALRVGISVPATTLVELTPWMPTVAAAVASLTILGAIWYNIGGLSRTSLEQTWYQYGSWVIAATCAAFIWPEEEIFFSRYLIWLQFIILLPFWQLWVSYYQKSALQKIAFKSPWGIGGVLMLAVIGLAYNSLPLWKPTNPLALTHIQKVGEDVTRQGWVQPNEPLAVLSNHPAIVAGMAYTLREKTIVQPAAQIFQQSAGKRTAFHHKLREQGSIYLWINSPTPEVIQMFQRNLKSNHSYLFKITPSSFRLLKAYPHINYSGHGWNN